VHWILVKWHTENHGNLYSTNSNECKKIL
jgi:hypothetical protein